MKKLLLLLLIIGCEENSTEPRDCAGVAGGSAVVDKCGVCAGTNTDGVCSECGDGYELLWDVCYDIETTQSISLGSQGLSGEIPIEIGNLINLTDLNLGRNDLTGSIPPEIGQLTNLTYLYLWDNQLSGEIPSEIGQLTNLVELSLSLNQLSGSIPPEIGNLTNLGHLHLKDNQLSGTIPKEICNLPVNWDPYMLYNNQLCPPYPSCLSQSDIGTQDTTNCP